MRQVGLRRVEGERRAYELPGVGTLRFGTWFYTKPIAEAGGRRWRIARRGVLRFRATVTDERTGEVVVDARLRNSGSTFRVDGRDLEWSRPEDLPTNWLLTERGRKLAQFEAGRGREPVSVTVADGAALPPLALLLGCYLVIAASQDTAARATGGDVASIG